MTADDRLTAKDFMDIVNEPLAGIKVLASCSGSINSGFIHMFWGETEDFPSSNAEIDGGV